MAIQVTPGHADAVAYDTAANSDTYFSARGITTWTGDETAKEQALVRGADYLERKYADRWIGTKATSTQALAWPRLDVEDVDGYVISSSEIPRAVKYANFEAALLILTGTDLEPVLERAGAVARKKTKAGPVETETEYAGGAPSRASVTSIDGLLAGLVTGVNTVRLLRV